VSAAASLKRRFAVMVAVNVLCALVAIGAIFGYVARDVAALGPVFVAAVGAGVAAQVWFIVAFARAGAAAKTVKV